MLFMKKVLMLCFLIVFNLIKGYSQELMLAKTLALAFKEAEEVNKPVLLFIDFDRSMINKPENLPAGTKISYASGIDDQEVIDKINKNFIVYKTLINDTSIRSIIRSAGINSFPSYVFLNSKKDIIYKDYGNSSSKTKYLMMVDNAVLASKEKPISELEKEFNADKFNNNVLKQLIDKRKKLGIVNNADLIEQYASNLKIGDFKDYQTVLYILEAGPYADGAAYKLTRSEPKIIDSIYKTEIPQKRAAFNNATISNTMIDAAKNKNIKKAYAGANFARSTWTNDYRSGDKTYNNQMLWYFNSVKDTANYIKTASYFYDNYYMNISADSIKKIEAKNVEQMNKNLTPHNTSKIVSKEKLDSLTKVSKVKIITQSVVTVSPSSNNYASELNNAAWKFYEIGTKNINHLSKAMIWSRRSIELHPISGYYDTLAHILYRMGYFEEAIKTQEEAIKRSNIEGRNATQLQNELKKMKSKSI